MESSFFKGKRPWSRIKDQILNDYMTPYLNKVARLDKQIILIDAFAGPGKFEDGTIGSPLIICNAAEENVKNLYKAIFVNKERRYHKDLTGHLRTFIKQKKVIPIHGTAQDLLEEISGKLTGQTIFLYIDPFAYTGFEFSMIEPFITRDRAYSTEIVINLNVPVKHRLASANAIAAGRHNSEIERHHRKLSKVLGGDYWKEILLDTSKGAESQASEVMMKYREKISKLGLPYTGSCPVREKEGRSIKYYITFCSRHPDAMELMNDIMCKAYHQRMYYAATIDTLFENTDWRHERSIDASLLLYIK